MLLRFSIVPSLSVLMLTVLFLVGCSGEKEREIVRETRFMMGSFVHFTIVDMPESEALDAIAAAEEEMRRVELLFTVQGHKNSPVQQFNHQPVGESMQLPRELSSLLKTSLEIEKESNHSFSPLLGGLTHLWGFSNTVPPAAPPEDNVIQRQLIAADAKWIRQDKNGWKRLHQLLQLDFGAIAKGYAIDQGIAVLKAHHVQNAILEAGGDLRLLGSKHGKPWRIGIRHPRIKAGVLGWVELEGDHSIVTSGDYERFFIWKGERFHHILNPATGESVSGSQSATVIAPNATLADAWSTALFVAGKKGLQMVEKIGFDGLWVDMDGKPFFTKGMREKFHVQE